MIIIQHLKKRKPSVFDNRSDINDFLSNLDNYDFGDLFKFWVKILKLNDNLLVLIMMYIDKNMINFELFIKGEEFEKYKQKISTFYS